MKNKVKKVSNLQQLEELLTRGVVEIVGRDLLRQKLVCGEQMRIYLGVDPTGPEIHLGHAVILRKLWELQKLGHQVILLVGDFTGRIGDPTDRTAARQKLSAEQVLANAKNYQQQAAKILEFSKNATASVPAKLDFNARWLEKLSFADVIELASNFTVQQMLERDMFAERMNKAKPIYLHEFLYPLMQGYDSVAQNVDVEVGGTDQLFNMLVGRTMMANLKGKEKIVMAFDLLEGLDGRKMSKSYGNTVGIMDAPEEMFGKIMSLHDELIVKYFWLTTNVERGEIERTNKQMASGVNPRDAKMRLARELVTFYHSAAAAKAAEQKFIKTFQRKETPTDAPELVISRSRTDLVTVLTETRLASSKAEARRLMGQGGVRVNDVKILNSTKVVELVSGDVLQIGKRKFFRLRVQQK